MRNSPWPSLRLPTIAADGFDFSSSHEPPNPPVVVAEQTQPPWPPPASPTAAPPPASDRGAARRSRRNRPPLISATSAEQPSAILWLRLAFQQGASTALLCDPPPSELPSGRARRARRRHPALLRLARTLRPRICRKERRPAFTRLARTSRRGSDHHRRRGRLDANSAARCLLDRDCRRRGWPSAHQLFLDGRPSRWQRRLLIGGRCEASSISPPRGRQHARLPLRPARLRPGIHAIILIPRDGGAGERRRNPRARPAAGSADTTVRRSAPLMPMYSDASHDLLTGWQPAHARGALLATGGAAGCPRQHAIVRMDLDGLPHSIAKFGERRRRNLRCIARGSAATAGS